MQEKTPFSYNTHIRFRDLDAIGHVNNAVYFTYFEDSRAALLREYGLDFNAPDVFFILARIECEYKQPIVYDTQIAIHMVCLDVGKKSFRLGYTVTDRHDKSIVHALGESVQVCYDPETSRSVVVSEKLRSMLEKIQDNPPQ